MRKATLVLGVLLSLLTLIQANHRASKGRSALLKWRPYAEALDAGEDLYERGGPGAEGYPTLPLSLLIMKPFHACPPRVGALLWAAFQVALAWWIVWSALKLGAGSAGAFPPWGALIVLVLSFRVLHSDVQHGNLNLLVGATVASAARSYRGGRDLACGLFVALGAVLKVTPAFLVLWLVRKRSGRGLAGVALGVALFAYVLPGLFLGMERNAALAAGWWQQMVAPYLQGREITLMQSEHINQSLLGVLARLTTDAVAIPADPPDVPADVRVNLLALSAGGLRAVHLAASLLVLAVFWFCVRGRESVRDGRRLLGEISLAALAMVMLSERSWKHHYVLLAWPLAFLVLRVMESPRSRTWWLALGGLAASTALHALTGSAILGHEGSNLAEAYGVFLAGGAVLFACCAALLRAEDEPDAPV